jgi:chromosome segregation ATPase
LHRIEQALRQQTMIQAELAEIRGQLERATDARLAERARAYAAIGQRVDRLDADVAALTVKLERVVAALQTLGRSVSSVFRALDADVVDLDDDLPADLVEGGVDEDQVADVPRVVDKAG